MAIWVNILSVILRSRILPSIQIDRTVFQRHWSNGNLGQQLDFLLLQPFQMELLLYLPQRGLLPQFWKKMAAMGFIRDILRVEECTLRLNIEGIKQAPVRILPLLLIMQI